MIFYSIYPENDRFLLVSADSIILLLAKVVADNSRHLFTTNLTITLKIYPFPAGYQPHHPDPVSRRIPWRVSRSGWNLELERGQESRCRDRRFRRIRRVLHLHERRPAQLLFWEYRPQENSCRKCLLLPLDRARWTSMD